MISSYYFVPLIIDRSLLEVIDALFIRSSKQTGIGTQLFHILSFHQSVAVLSDFASDHGTDTSRPELSCMAVP